MTPGQWRFLTVAKPSRGDYSSWWEDSGKDDFQAAGRKAVAVMEGDRRPPIKRDVRMENRWEKQEGLARIGSGTGHFAKHPASAHQRLIDLFGLGQSPVDA